jgi:hypothetical protein
MSGRAALAEFAREALACGQDRAAIRAAMTDAGWSAPEADAALAAWAETGFRPPVPRPRPYVSAREAFLYALMGVALAAVVTNLAALAFEAIDGVWRDAGMDGRDLLARGRGPLAALIVFGPLLAVLVLRDRRADRDNALQHRSLVRKWFSYGTLLVAALVLLGNLVFVIYSLLGGTIATPTLLKVGVVALLALAVLALYRRDLTEDSG